MPHTIEAADGLEKRLREIKTRCESATRVPWINHGGDSEYIHPRVHSPDKLIADFGNAESWLDAGDEWEANASFCAHAREDIPWLLSEVERIGKESDDYRFQCGGMEMEINDLRDASSAHEQGRREGIEMAAKGCAEALAEKGLGYWADAVLASIRALSSAPPGEKVRVCPDGREFIIELATIMGVVDVGADSGTPVPVHELMASMLARATEDRERWHSEPGEKGERIPSGWKLVPVEPTMEMVRVAYASQPGAINTGFAQAYRTMLAASPTAKAEDGMREVDDAMVERAKYAFCISAEADPTGKYPGKKHLRAALRAALAKEGTP